LATLAKVRNTSATMTRYLKSQRYGARDFKVTQLVFVTNQGPMGNPYASNNR
jgi:hypothetical protein